MKVICTEEQKQELINAMAYFRSCPWVTSECEGGISCAECYEKNIEWEIEDE